jgi:ER-bound oxygenase mpaB/B'/Rubber oxygenase, catalytic domain
MRGRVIDAQGGGGNDREQRRAGRWSSGELNRLCGETDPEIDQVVEAYHREHPELDGRDLVRSMIQELSRAKREPQRFTRDAAGQDGIGLTAALNVALAPPRWNIDRRQVEMGQHVFADYGLYQASALFFASLPMAYASIDGAAVLARVSDLATHNLTRRVAETGQMLLDVMGVRGGQSPVPGSGGYPLEPGTPGYATAIGLRLLHACVRVLLLDQQGPGRWPAETYGAPVNQQLMLGTLLDFTAVPWAAMARMGVELTDAEREANLHTWSFIGLLMGVEACRDGPLSLGDVKQIQDELSQGLGPSEAGDRLMGALLEEMEEFMPLGWRKLPRSVLHCLFQGAPGRVSQVPNMLHVPPAAWWSRPLLALLQAANQGSRWLGPLAWPEEALIRKLGRHVLIGYADKYSVSPVPFRVPDRLARRWRIRIGPAGEWVRRKRRGARKRARARLPRRGGRTRGQGA